MSVSSNNKLGSGDEVNGVKHEVVDMEAKVLKPLPGYKNVLPFVYAGFFPVSND